MWSAENRYIYKVQYIGVLRVYIYDTANMLYSTCFWLCKKCKVASYELFSSYELLPDVR